MHKTLTQMISYAHKQVFLYMHLQTNINTLLLILFKIIINQKKFNLNFL